MPGIAIMVRKDGDLWEFIVVTDDVRKIYHSLVALIRRDMEGCVGQIGDVSCHVDVHVKLVW